MDTAEEITRSWTTEQRQRFWVVHYAKVISAFVASIAGLAAVLAALGLRFDLQTRTESRAEHAALVVAQDAKLERVAVKLEAAVTRLGERIDAALLAESRGPGRSRPR